MVISNSVLLQFGKKYGQKGSRTVTLPVVYTCYYSVSAMNRDNNNEGVSTVKLLESSSTLTSFVGIATWSVAGGNVGYSTATWDWITIGY